MNIAVIGSGGREHAIAWKLSQENSVKNVYILSHNILLPNSLKCDLENFSRINKCCQENNINLLIVGSEHYLSKGMVDFFHKTDIKIFGPTKKSAKLETSKIFAKQFMKTHNVATADFEYFDCIQSTKKYLSTLKKKPVVIKYDGLASGKGVFVCKNFQDSKSALKILEYKYGNNTKIIVEECLFGEELSFIVACGKNNFNQLSIQLLCTAKDYKRAYEGNKGPNTGGMGAICPHPSWNPKIEKSIMQFIVNPTIKGLVSENLGYCGFLYFGVMLTQQGPKLLEYNTRMGDPEAQTILPIIKEDLSSIILNALTGKLVQKKSLIKNQFIIDVTLASKGYPDHFETRKVISGIEKLNPETLVFYSNVLKDNNKLYTNGGRVMHIASQAKSAELAREKVYAECNKIHFDNITYRQDIGAI